MKWITNIPDPNHPDFVKHMTSRLPLTYSGNQSIGQLLDETIKEQMEYMADKIVGDPMPSDTYSVKNLKKDGYIGLYARETPLPDGEIDFDKIATRIGYLIRNARMKSGLTRAEVAFATGLSNGRYCQIERGHNTPLIQTLYRIAQVLDVKPGSLLPKID